MAATVADPPAFHVKAIAIASMILVGGYSIFFAVEATGLKITGGVFVALGLVTVLLLKMCKEKAG